MLSKSIRVLGFAALATAVSAPPKVEHKDVVVIGGGASGAYASVILKEDYGKSIALVEKEEILGGHVDSYTDPDTGVTYNFGVVSFIDSGNASSFFERLGIEVGTSTNVEVTTEYYDFTTGETVDFQPPPFPDQVAAMANFLPPAEKYEPMIQGPGYFDFPEPENIPEELLMPFGDFITKYGAEKAMPFLYASTGLGLGNITNEMTIWALQTFGASMARSLMGLQGSLPPASGRIQDVYDAIGARLGDDVMYSSTVTDVTRKRDGVHVTIKNHHTCQSKVIIAKKLLVAIEPTPSNIKPLKLDVNTRAVLGKFQYINEYTGIIDNPNLVKGMSYFNLPPNAAPNNYLSYPEPSYTARIDYMGSGHYFRVTIVGDGNLDAAGAKQLVQDDFSKLIEAGVLEGSPDDKVSWVDFSAHGPMHAHVSKEELLDGYIQDLYALQGKQDTWWTGGAWVRNFQTHLWEFDDVILAKMAEEF